MAYISSIMLFGAAIIDPDPTIQTDPYFALRSPGDTGGVLGAALSMRIIKWRLYFSGSYTYTLGGGTGPTIVFSSTFSAVCDITMQVSTDERGFGKILPPDGMTVPNRTLKTATGSEVFSNNPVIGLWSLTVDGVETSNGDLVIAPNSVTTNDCDINSDAGYDYIQNLFGIKFKLTIPIAAVATGVPPLESDIVFRLATEPGSLGADRATQSPIGIGALNWNGEADNRLIPVYSDQTITTNPALVSATLDTEVFMVPYGQSPTPHPETNGLVLPWGRTTGEDDDPTRIWNQDSTAHRLPVYPFTLLP